MTSPTAKLNLQNKAECFFQMIDVMKSVGQVIPLTPLGVIVTKHALLE